MEVLVIWVGVAVVTGLAAQARGRSFVLWLILGAVLSVFALLAVLVMQRVDAAPPAVTAGARPAAMGGGAGDLIKTYRGEQIRHGSTRGQVVAMGRAYSGVIAAERAIDAAQARPVASDVSGPLPRLAGDGEFEQVVAGTSKYQQVVRKAWAVPNRHKFNATLRQEPDNPHDANAVQVLIDGELAGYLPRPDAAAFVAAAPAIAIGPDGVRVWACVVGDNHDTKGLRLDLAWPLRR